jgi:hypothetical protein
MTLEEICHQIGEKLKGSTKVVDSELRQEFQNDEDTIDDKSDLKNFEQKSKQELKSLIEDKERKSDVMIMFNTIARERGMETDSTEDVLREIDNLKVMYFDWYGNEENEDEEQDIESGGNDEEEEEDDEEINIFSKYMKKPVMNRTRSVLSEESENEYEYEEEEDKEENEEDELILKEEEKMKALEHEKLVQAKKREEEKRLTYEIRKEELRKHEEFLKKLEERGTTVDIEYEKMKVRKIGSEKRESMLKESPQKPRESTSSKIVLPDKFEKFIVNKSPLAAIDKICGRKPLSTEENTAEGKLNYTKYIMKRVWDDVGVQGKKYVDSAFVKKILLFRNFYELVIRYDLAQSKTKTEVDEVNKLIFIWIR